VGPEPGRRRGSGHLPHRGGASRRAEGPTSAASRTSATRTSTPSSRRGPHLLGPVAHAGIPLRRPFGLPAGVKTELGPDATGLGWVFQYVSRRHLGKAEPRRPARLPGLDAALQLRSVPGVAEVAPVAASAGQYQVERRPEPAAGLRYPDRRVVEAVRGGNAEAGGRLIEFGGTEYMVRGAATPSRSRTSRTSFSPPRRRELPSGSGTWGGEHGPDLRRGVMDLDGEGRPSRHRRDAARAERLDVIDRVKARIKEIEPGLPTARRSSDLRPLGADPPVDRQPANDADRGHRHRRPRHPPLPLAHPSALIP